MNSGNAGLFGSGNLADTASATVTPTLRKRFNDFEASAQYSYGRVWYLDLDDLATTTVNQDLEDSTDQMARAAFGTAETDRNLTGQVFYEWNKSEFEVSPDYRYDRLGFDGGWQFADTLTLVGDVGVESALDEDTSTGGLDDNYWSAGLRWVPGANTSAEARFGQRFFGDSYYVAVKRRARALLIEAEYSEEPTVESVRVGTTLFNPGELPPNNPGIGTRSRVVGSIRREGWAYYADCGGCPHHDSCGGPPHRARLPERKHRRGNHGRWRAERDPSVRRQLLR